MASFVILRENLFLCMRNVLFVWVILTSGVKSAQIE